LTKQGQWEAQFLSCFGRALENGKKLHVMRILKGKAKVLPMKNYQEKQTYHPFIPSQAEIAKGNRQTVMEIK